MWNYIYPCFCAVFPCFLEWNGVVLKFPGYFSKNLHILELRSRICKNFLEITMKLLDNPISLAKTGENSAKTRENEISLLKWTKNWEKYYCTTLGYISRWILATPEFVFQILIFLKQETHSSIGSCIAGSVKPKAIVWL